MHILLRKNSEYYVTKIIYGNGTTIEKKNLYFHLGTKFCVLNRYNFKQRAPLHVYKTKQQWRTQSAVW